MESGADVLGVKPYKGTIIADPNFDAEISAKLLRETVKGIGTNDKKLIEVLTRHTNEQRQAIESKYNEIFETALRDDLESDLSGHYKDMCCSLLDPPVVFDCKELQRAVNRLGTDESTLVEILFSRPTETLEKIKVEYKTLYGVALDFDIAEDTSGDFLHLLHTQIFGKRDTSNKVNKEMARQDAQELYAAGEGRFGTSERKFNNLLCSRSFLHLREICLSYTKIAGHDIEEAIASETSGELYDAYTDIVRMAKGMPGYFAHRIYKSMKGPGTKDLNLIRLLISRSEIDMVQVKEEFQKQHKEDLVTAIEGDTMGDYKVVLLALIGHRLG